MRQFRTDSLRWMVGIFCGLLGTMMLVTPHQFVFLWVASLPASLSILGISLLAVGIGILISIVMVTDKRATAGLMLAAAFLLCGMALALFFAGGPLNGINLFLLGAGAGITPFLKAHKKPDPPASLRADGSFSAEKKHNSDLLALILGVSGLLAGIVLLFGHISTVSYRLDDLTALILGIGFLLGGAGVVLAQLSPLLARKPGVEAFFAHPLFARLPYALLASLFFAFLLLATRANNVWFGAAYYGWFGLGLLVLPRLFPARPRFDPTQLHIRLALAFSLACALPLILTVTLINWFFAAPALQPIGAERAFNIRDMTMGVLLFFLLIMIYGGVRTARWLILPIERLSAAAQALAEGEGDTLLPSSTVTEVQRLANTFSAMRARLAERTAERERAQFELEEHRQMLEMRVAARTAELRLSNQRMEALLSALPVGVMISDAKGRIIEKNGMADKIWGGNAPLSGSVEEYEAYQGWWPETGENVKPQSWALARAVCNGEIVWGEVTDILRFDGQPATVLNSAAPIRDELGMLQGAVMVMQDISQQRKTERMARESARAARKNAGELEAIFNSLTDAVLLYNADGTVQQANSRVVAMFGFDPIRMNMDQIIHKINVRDETGQPVDSSAMPSNRALEGHSNVNMRLIFTNPRGREYVTLVSASPVYVGRDLVGVVAVWHDITERERLMTENRRQRELLERLIREAPMGIALTEGPDFRYTLVNPAYERITRGKGSPMGRPAQEVWPELDDTLLPLFQEVYDTGQPIRQVDELFCVERGSGMEEDYFTFSLTPLLDENGKVESILVMTMETTEEVNTRAEAEEERARLQAIIEHAPEGIVVMDSSGKVMLLNPAAERISGRQRREDIFDPSRGSFVFKPDGRPFPMDSFPVMEAVKTGSAYQNIEMVMRRPDGKLVPVLVNAAPVRDSNGEITGAVGIFQDVTEIVETTRALRESEGRFRGLVESMNDIVFTLDSEQVFTGVFGLGLERFGEASETYQGKRLEEVMGPSAPIHLAAFTSAMAGKSLVYEWAEETSQGLVHFQNSVAPLRADDGRVTGVVGIARDVTLSKRSEQSLEKYAEQLQRSNQELEQFAFIASHDLQEPLRKIQAFGQRIQQRMSDRIAEDEQDYLNRMVSASERMQKMIHDLLTFSRVTTKGQPFVEVDLNTVVGEVLEDLEVRIERSGAAVQVEGLPVLEADAMQMQQLLQNLIGNALKYQQPGTRPEVRVIGQVLPVEPGGRDGSAKGQREWVSIQVIDNGIGFDEQYTDRIFQPFERLHGRSEFEGTGMGLAICRKIVERHHGTLTARSQPGSGSMFVVTLPRKQPENRK